MKRTKERSAKVRRTARKPAADRESMDPLHLINDAKIKMSLRLRMACNMLASADTRAIPFIEGIAKRGEVRQRIRAQSALMRFKTRSGPKIAKAAKKKGEVMQEWYDRVDNLSTIELMNFTPEHLKQWLKELHEGGADRRNRARKWEQLIATPQVLKDYLASMTEQDRDV